MEAKGRSRLSRREGAAVQLWGWRGQTEKQLRRSFTHLADVGCYTQTSQSQIERILSQEREKEQNVSRNNRT
jgi:hypothetical protein